MKKVGAHACAFRYLIAGVLACAASFSYAVETWSSPAVVSGDVNGQTARPRFATDRAGRWTEVWQRVTDDQSRTARSADNANSWTSSEALPFDLSSPVDKGNPDVAAELTSGTFVTVYLSDNNDGKFEFTTARSTLTNTSSSLVGTPVGYVDGLYSGILNPRIAAGGNRVYVTAASSSSGSDERLLLFRTLNEGDSWNAPFVIDQSTGTLGLNRNLGIASDASNNWVTVWERQVSGNPNEVYYSRSADNGVTWIPAMRFATGSGSRSQPAVAADSDNAFVSLVVQGTGAAALQAFRTVDGGAIWSGPAVVSNGGPAITDTPTNPDVACDGQGSCVAVWSATSGGTKRLFFSTSANRGQNWSVADYLTTATGTASDDLPQVEYDGQGRWITTWQRSTNSGSTVQLLSSKLVFPTRADLSVTQTDEPDPVAVNGTVTYKLTVKNDGPSSATNVILKDTLPTTGSTSVTHSQGTHTETSGVVTIKIGSMAPGATVTAAVATKLGTAGIYTNTAALSSTEPDVDTQDRISTETTRVLVDGIDLQGEWTDFKYKVPRNPERGKLRIHGTFSVSNFGTKRSGQTVALLVFSDDEILSDDDPFCDTVEIEMLGSGKTREIEFDKVVHRRTPWQGRSLLVILDSEQRIHEADETNNTFLSEMLDE